MSALHLAPQATRDRAVTVKFVDSRIASRLRIARHEAGMSQETVGKAIGLTFQQVQKYEKGSNRISPGKLAVLAQLYNKPISWFYQGLEDTTAATPPGLIELVLENRGGKRLIENYLAASPEDQVIAIDVVECFARRAARRMAQAAE
jgi:transcriptional regulator with XRE-family HTH domain